MSLEPRLDPDEIDYLTNFLEDKPKDTTMIEWGSGGSTVMFVKHFKTGRLISVEHNPEWYDKVIAELTNGSYEPAYLKNFTYAFRPPIVDIRFYGYGVPYEENPCYAKDYINPRIIDDGNIVNIWDSDIFFVDGICRGAILATIANKARKSSVYDATEGRWETKTPAVFIHDYYGPEQREPWYNWASSLFSKVEKVGNTLARLYL